ncbi:MAG: sigma-70 family RNA polymerase sigma factor [Acidimicrobiales bacterium]
MAKSIDVVCNRERTGSDWYEEWVRNNGPRLNTYARRRGAADPEGLINEAFAQVLTGVGDVSVERESELRAKLVRSVDRLLTDEQRQLSTIPFERDLAELREQEVPTDSGFEELVSDADHAQWLLSWLTPEQREIIELRYLHDLSFGETAERVGRPVGTVKALQHRAMQRMRIFGILVALIVLAVGVALLARDVGTQSLQPISSDPEPTEVDVPNDGLSSDGSINETSDLGSADPALSQSGIFIESGTGTTDEQLSVEPSGLDRQQIEPTGPGAARSSGIAAETATDPRSTPADVPEPTVVPDPRVLVEPDLGVDDGASAEQTQPNPTPTTTVPEQVSVPLAEPEIVGALSNPSTGFCLTAGQPGPTQEVCVGSNQQNWSMISVAGGAVLVLDQATARCLEAVGVTGSQVTQTPCGDTQSQRWTQRAGATGLAEFVHVSSGHCLDVRDGSTTWGVDLVLWGCHGRANQQWQIAAVAPDGPAEPTPPVTSVSYVQNQGSQLCLSVGIDYSAVQQPCGGTQTWSLRPAVGNTLSVVNTESGKCLDVQNGAIENGTPVGHWTCTDNPNQHWELRSAADGSVAFVNPTTGRCLDVRNGSISSGTDLIIWDCTGAPNQQWIL